MLGVRLEGHRIAAGKSPGKQRDEIAGSGRERTLERSRQGDGGDARGDRLDLGDALGIERDGGRSGQGFSLVARQGDRPDAFRNHRELGAVEL